MTKPANGDRGRMKCDFERHVGTKFGALDLSLDDKGMYACHRTRDLFTAFKLGTVNAPERKVNDGQHGASSILTALDADDVPRTLRSFSYRNSAIRLAKELAQQEPGSRYGIYSLHTVVFNPGNQVETNRAT